MLKPGEEWVWVPFEVDKVYDGFRIDRFLSRRLASYSRSRIQKILQEARVLKQGKPARASTKVRTGERVEIAYPRKREDPVPEGLQLPILFEDDHLLVIDKPSGLLSHPTDKTVLHTVTGLLKARRPDIPAAYLLHRLDRETSGVLALAKHPAAAKRWTQAMEKHEVQKEYLALVSGIPEPRAGRIDQPIGREGKEIKIRQAVTHNGGVSAITDYQTERISDLHRVSLVRAFPRTGRLHQIRVHLASRGWPLLGDKLYQGSGELYLKMIQKTLRAEETASTGFPRVALHAAVLSFFHPISGHAMRIEAPFPGDMAAFIEHGSFSDTLSIR